MFHCSIQAQDTRGLFGTLWKVQHCSLLKADEKEGFWRCHTSHWKPDLVGKFSTNCGNTMRCILCKSCYSLISGINNNSVVSKDYVLREGFMYNIMKVAGQKPLGGQANWNFMAVEDELPFLTCGFLLSLMMCHSSTGQSSWGECSPKLSFWYQARGLLDWQDLTYSETHLHVKNTIKKILWIRAV